MALTLLRRRAAPTPPRETAEPPPHGDANPADLLPDDYLIEGEELPARLPKAARLVQTLQIVLILIIAALSLAIFWLIGLMLDVF